MGLILEDGSGRGHEVEVTRDKALQVRSESQAAEHHASLEHGAAFSFVSGARTVTSPGEYGILAVRNNGVVPFALTCLRLTYSDVEVSQMLIEINVGGTWVAGTAYDAGKTQFNTESGTTADDFDNHYDAVPTSSSNIETVWKGAGPQDWMWHTNGALIIARGGIVSLRVVTETASAVVHGRINGFLTRES